MKKILAVFDATKYAEGASKYAIEIAKTTNSLLVGVFVQDMRYINYTYAYAWEQPFIDFTSIDEAQKEENEKKLKEMQEQQYILQSAAGNLNDTDKKAFEKIIGKYIKEIDKCIALLSE